MKKRTRRKVWTLMNPLTLAIEAAAPATGEDLERLRVGELAAIESFVTGTATHDDWNLLRQMANVSQCMAIKGVGVEAFEPSESAQRALALCYDRARRLGKYGLTGPELTALRECQSYHDLQRVSIPRREYEGYIALTMAWEKNGHLVKPHAEYLQEAKNGL